NFLSYRVITFIINPFFKKVHILKLLFCQKKTAAMSCHVKSRRMVFSDVSPRQRTNNQYHAPPTFLSFLILRPPPSPHAAARKGMHSSAAFAAAAAAARYVHCPLR